jgi:hypothetical protein
MVADDQPVLGAQASRLLLELLVEGRERAKAREGNA